MQSTNRYFYQIETISLITNKQPTLRNETITRRQNVTTYILIIFAKGHKQNVMDGKVQRAK